MRRRRRGGEDSQHARRAERRTRAGMQHKLQPMRAAAAARGAARPRVRIADRVRQLGAGGRHRRKHQWLAGGGAAAALAGSTQARLLDC